jgi:predicted dehydrogenase
MRVAVVGVGVMGRNHARVYSEMDDVELVGVVDADPVAAARVAQRFRAPAYADLAALLAEAQPQAISVAVPTSLHCSVAQQVIESGVHVLVEKPIASSVPEGQALIAAAERHSVVLAIGHVERFNPAVVELKRRLETGDLGRVFQIFVRRVGPFPPRVKDVGVTVDLATHDLDVMCHLVGARVIRLYAETEQRVHTEHEDLLSGLLRFADGTVGILDINWLVPTKIRQLTVVGERGMFHVDYLTQTLRFYENETAREGWESLQVLRGVTEGNMIQLRIVQREPLRVELEAFIAAARGRSSTIVTGAEGLRALHLAERLRESGRMGQVIAEPDLALAA